MNILDQSPDLILTNGRFHILDLENTVVRAVAVRDGRILATGNERLIGDMAGPATKVIDLEGKTVIPGIFDSHAHLQEVGLKLAAIRLDECKSPEEMMELVREKAADTPPGTWIVGMGWNEGNFSDADGRIANGRMPTKHDIDPATDQHPVILQRFFNCDVVNSKALELAGITSKTPDPAGGKIEHDEHGEPNGLIRAGAKLLVRNLLPKATQTDLKNAIRLGCEEFNRFGITSTIEPGLRPHQLQSFQDYHQETGMSVRTALMPSWHGFFEDETTDELDARAKQYGLHSGFGNEWLQINGLKMAIDGGSSPHTAWMYEPFEGEDAVIDYNRMSPADLERYFRMAQELGWDIGIHACGDRAQDVVASAFAKVAQDVPRPDARHNIIHAYFPTDTAIEQMAEHNIAAVVQPTFLYWEGNMIFRDVGEKRAANWKPVRKYLDRGVHVTASSDVPSTVSVNPFVGMYALVTRMNNLGREVGWDQAVTRREALRMYTADGTWLTREEKLKGTLEPGKLADFAVLDRNYFSIPVDEIKDVQVDLTLCGGKVVWERA
ncbi:MAG: putative amidohydrolase YtcJ [Cellvibrionaceae bacterium]|jgi:predicted amidohydrolase YtcJ